MKSKTKDMPKVCAECPWSRQSKPGHLGGSEPEVYIGQATGAFFLPCHLTYSADSENIRDNLDCTGGCAGAAIYRANVGIDHRLPDEIHKLPADHGPVFSSPVEFLAHHKGISLGQAFNQLINQGPNDLLKIEMDKVEMRYLNKDRTISKDQKRRD